MSEIYPTHRMPDGRPYVLVPRRDAPVLPIMRLLDRVLGDAFPELPPKAKRGERYQLEELIERHIAFDDGSGRAVRLPSAFVTRYISWRRRGEHRT
jgi:hypothetical protein